MSKPGPVDEADLPEGYTIEVEDAFQEESGESRKVLLIKRPGGSVAWVFSFSATSPSVETVRRRAWDDDRARREAGIA